MVLLCSFLLGLELEEHKGKEESYSFGGVRTLPLIAVLGYVIALFSGDSLLTPALGSMVVGGFLLIAYYHKLSLQPDAGVTSELTGLLTYWLGALVTRGHYWITGSVVVITLLLLELKKYLEGLAQRIDGEEIQSIAKFLLLSIVILPIVPNQEFTEFHINPFKTWLVVVAVNAISYASYAIQKTMQGRGGVLVSALLGGAYSSTVTTVVLAKASGKDPRPQTYSAAILLASGVMYLRFLVLLALFNTHLLAALAPSFIGLAALASAVAFFISRQDSGQKSASQRPPPRNPLELGTAFLFAFLFLVILVVTQLALRYLGARGVFTLAGLMGLSDIDPFILGLTQSGTETSLAVAASSILIAASSNNLAKGCYALAFGERRTGRYSLGLLAILALIGLVPLFWV
jgi:uncharacterized membrane protein (DUF4010 family)